MPIDYSKYPENWLTEIRPAILKRAKDCCEFCGLPNYAWVDKKRELCLQDEDEAIRIVLTIAHLDHNIQNNSEANLRALCQKCHLDYDRPEKMKNRATKARELLGMDDLFKEK